MIIIAVIMCCFSTPKQTTKLPGDQDALGSHAPLALSAHHEAYREGEVQLAASSKPLDTPSFTYLWNQLTIQS